MPFDYKKEYKEFYMPPKKPRVVDMPAMNYIAVRGKGDPNDENGEYKESIGLLYGIAFTIKMSYKGDHKIDGYFEYVVPPLEGFWWQDGVEGIDYSHKENFNFMPRLLMLMIYPVNTQVPQGKIAAVSDMTLPISMKWMEKSIRISFITGTRLWGLVQPLALSTIPRHLLILPTY